MIYREVWVMNILMLLFYLMLQIRQMYYTIFMYKIVIKDIESDFSQKYICDDSPSIHFLRNIYFVETGRSANQQVENTVLYHLLLMEVLLYSTG